jgi:hypothetical protein
LRLWRHRAGAGNYFFAGQSLTWVKAVASKQCQGCPGRGFPQKRLRRRTMSRWCQCSMSTDALHKAIARHCAMRRQPPQSAVSGMGRLVRTGRLVCSGIVGAMSGWKVITGATFRTNCLAAASRSARAAYRAALPRSTIRTDGVTVASSGLTKSNPEGDAAEGQTTRPLRSSMRRRSCSLA